MALFLLAHSCLHCFRQVGARRDFLLQWRRVRESWPRRAVGTRLVSNGHALCRSGREEALGRCIPLGIPRPCLLTSDTTTTARLLTSRAEKGKASAGKSRASKKPAPALSPEQESSAVSSSDDDDDNEEDSSDSRDDVVSSFCPLVSFCTEMSFPVLLIHSVTALECALRLFRNNGSFVASRVFMYAMRLFGA